MWKRLLIVLLVMACSAPLCARGRARSYHPGAGVHRQHPAKKKSASKPVKKPPPPTQPAAAMTF